MILNRGNFLFKNPFIFNKDTINELLLIKERNANSEVWVGKKLGVRGAELILEIQKNIMKLTDLLFDPIFIFHLISFEPVLSK